MTFKGKVQTVLAVATLGVAPVAMTSSAVAHTASTAHTTPAQAKAYGRMCAKAGASKRHIAGQKGTPFSDCVTALAKMAHTHTLSPGRACAAAGEKKVHTAGQRGTPFSQCVTAGKQLRAKHHTA